MSDPQRYDMVMNYRCGQSVDELEKADDGEWVRWEDVQARIEHAEAEVAQLRPLVMGNCPHCGAWVNFAQEAELEKLAPSPVPAEPKP